MTVEPRDIASDPEPGSVTSPIRDAGLAKAQDAGGLAPQRTGHALGIDVGGTGVKAAVVDLATGALVTDRIRRPTPKPATPQAVAGTIAQVVATLRETELVTDEMPVGVGLPGVLKDGRLVTAANIDPGWLKASAEGVIGGAIGRRVIAVNDADAAGIAEADYGAASGREGSILLLTLGTGIGTALIIDGHLVPNLELGHIELHGKDAETQVSGAARERRKLSWKEWAKEFNDYLGHMEAYLWPDLIILGGGVSKSFERFERFLKHRAPVVPAKLLNSAGIVGAGAFAAGAGQQRSRGTVE